MTHEDHIEIHEYLHKQLEILISDWIQETDLLPSEITLSEFAAWSYDQTINPSDNQGFENEQKREY